MKKKLLSIMLIGFIAFFASSWTFVKGPKTVVFQSAFDNSSPISGTQFNPCAGELIDFSGNVHDWGTYVMYSDGSVHQNWHYNYSNFSGVGQTSGKTYQFTGAGHFNINSNVGSVNVIVQHGNVIGQGMGLVSKFKADLHSTVNANGQLVSTHGGFSFDCN
jgi:hypothetical protein